MRSVSFPANPPFQGSSDKAGKQRVRLVGTALELRVELHADEEALAPNLDGLHQPPVGGEAGEHEAGVGQRVAVGVVELVAVAVALADFGGDVAGSSWELAPSRPATCRAYASTAICMPRQMPK